MASNTTAAILTIVGGVFYVIGGAIFGLVVGSLSSLTSGIYGNFGLTNTTPSSLSVSGLDSLGYAVAAFGVLSGVLIIVGGLLFRYESGSRRKVGGILAIIMMLIGALATLGGLLIGFIITAIGVYLGLTYKSRGAVVGLGPIGYVSLGSGSHGGQATGTGPTNYCTKCGSKLREGAIFCGACGERI